MRRTIIGGLALILAATLPGEVPAASNATIAHHVAPWVSAATLIRPAADSDSVTVSVYLSFKDKAGAIALAQAVSTPGSASYGKYLTPDEFRAKYAPDASQVALVEKTLTGLGLTVGRVAKSGLYVEATGTVAKVRSAFKVSQNLYSYKGKTLRSNIENPTVPAALVGIVSYIGGLDQTGVLRKPLNVRSDGLSTTAAAAVHPASTAPSAPPPVAANLPSSFCSTYWGDKTATVTNAAPYPSTLPWLICGYTPQQIQVAYGAQRAGETGAGVKVAIVDAYASPTILDDANRYSANHNLPKFNTTTFRQILPPGIYDVSASDACGPQGWYGEESLDVDSVHSIAPNASIVYVGAADCYTIQDYLYDAIDNDVADIITNSYGENGEYESPAEDDSENLGFIQAKAEGISLLFSSGDDGDLSQDNGVASGAWPATSPYVTAVGGTSLALYNANGNKSEWGWGNYRALFLSPTVSADGKTVTDSGLDTFSFYAGAGGGPSLTQAEPIYQSNTIPDYLADQTYTYTGEYIPLTPSKRVTPDIAMDADPYTGMLYGETFTIAGDPVSDSGCVPTSATLEYCESAIGGTSLASPLFAGILALADQHRAAAKLTPIGFVNTRLYGLQVARLGITAPIIDIVPPYIPTAVLRGYQGNPNKLRLVTINSQPYSGCSRGVCQGVDDVFNFTDIGYDNVTGLGVPFAPMIVRTLGTD